MAKKKRKKGRYIDEEGFCEACGKMGVALHHVKTFGSFGSDHPENLMPLCIEHHNEVHNGLEKFAQKWPRVLAWLERNNWERDEFTGKWWREEKK